jgi:hypothetical protein
LHFVAGVSFENCYISPKTLIHICQILGPSFCLKIRCCPLGGLSSYQLTDLFRQISQILSNKKMTTQKKKADFVLLGSKLYTWDL